MPVDSKNHDERSTSLSSVVRADIRSVLRKLGVGQAGIKKERTTYHFVLIEAEPQIVGAQIRLWGEARWWPANCSLKFVRKTLGDVDVGTRYTIKLQGIVPFSWEAEVSKLIPEREIEKILVKGVIEGRENIIVEGRYNGTKVSYYLHYHIDGLLDNLLWRLIWKPAYNKNIKMALEALKKFAEQTTNTQEQS